MQYRANRSRERLSPRQALQRHCQICAAALLQLYRQVRGNRDGFPKPRLDPIFGMRTLIFHQGDMVSAKRCDFL